MVEQALSQRDERREINMMENASRGTTPATVKLSKGWQARAKVLKNLCGKNQVTSGVAHQSTEGTGNKRRERGGRVLGGENGERPHAS